MANPTLDWQDRPPETCRSGAVSVGNFDGVHRGHASLIAALRAQADQLNGPAVALTFDPHPLDLLRPGRPQPRVTLPEDKIRLLHALGADHVVTLRTTPEMLALSAEEFFHRVLRAGFDARAFVEGVNFGFGKNREGNAETLARLGKPLGLAVTVVPPVLVDGQPVSSSRVRALLASGAVADAAALLGRPYRLRGTVGTGERRGGTIGFPTANLTATATLIPRDGVYAARAAVDGQDWPAAVNVGPNPTFGEHQRKVEAHLIGYAGDLYGRPLALDFLRRLRDTRAFGGVEELVAQLRRDVAAVAEPD